MNEKFTLDYEIYVKDLGCLIISSVNTVSLLLY